MTRRIRTVLAVALGLAAAVGGGGVCLAWADHDTDHTIAQMTAH